MDPVLAVVRTWQNIPIVRDTALQQVLVEELVALQPRILFARVDPDLQ